MKPYGIPRVREAEFPDVADIQKFGFKSSCGRIAGKSGDYRPYIRGNHKAWVRRIWKKRERTITREAIRNMLD